MKDIIEIQDFSLSYSDSDILLKAENLTLSKGEIVVLFGDNGSGKSSLLRSIRNASKEWQGQIKIEGRVHKDWRNKELVKKIAFISTESEYPSLLSTKDYVALGRYPHLNWFGKLQRKDKTVIQNYLKECCIEELSNQAISSLSDGEKQRAKIARGLCQETPILILDEPSSHLDVKNTYATLELIKLEREKENKSILFSSHEINMSLEIADKVWYIINGRVEQLSKSDFMKNREIHKTLFGSTFQILR